MRTYTGRELRHAVFLTVLLTTLAVVALLDPTCRRPDSATATAPSRSLHPR